MGDVRTKVCTFVQHNTQVLKSRFYRDGRRKSAGLCFLVMRIDSHFCMFNVNIHFLHQGVIIAICFCISILAVGSCLSWVYIIKSSAKSASLVDGVRGKLET